MPCAILGLPRVARRHREPRKTDRLSAFTALCGACVVSVRTRSLGASAMAESQNGTPDRNSAFRKQAEDFEVAKSFRRLAGATASITCRCYFGRWLSFPPLSRLSQGRARAARVARGG